MSEDARLRGEEPPICDFCGAQPDGLWYFPHLQFELFRAIPPRLESIVFQAGRWSACEECAALFEREDVGGLLTRAIQRYGASRAQLLQTAYICLLTKRSGPPRWVAGVATAKEANEVASR